MISKERAYGYIGIIFKTLSFLPATENKFDICSKCCDYIVFREDINTEMGTYETVAEKLHKDIVHQFKSSENISIRHKLGLDDYQKPTEETLQLLLHLSSRFVGLASLYPIKSYDRYYERLKKKMDQLEIKVKHNLPQALYLRGPQTEVFKSLMFTVTGLYGVGKYLTT